MPRRATPLLCKCSPQSNTHHLPHNSLAEASHTTTPNLQGEGNNKSRGTQKEKNWKYWGGALASTDRSTLSNN